MDIKFIKIGLILNIIDRKEIIDWAKKLNSTNVLNQDLLYDIIYSDSFSNKEFINLFNINQNISKDEFLKFYNVIIFFIFSKYKDDELLKKLVDLHELYRNFLNEEIWDEIIEHYLLKRDGFIGDTKIYTKIKNHFSPIFKNNTSKKFLDFFDENSFRVE